MKTEATPDLVETLAAIMMEAQRAERMLEMAPARVTGKTALRRIRLLAQDRLDSSGSESATGS